MLSIQCGNGVKKRLINELVHNIKCASFFDGCQTIESHSIFTIVLSFVIINFYYQLIMSRFSCVESAPPVAIFALSKAYREDPHPKKVDLGIGGRLRIVCPILFISFIHLYD